MFGPVALLVPDAVMLSLALLFGAYLIVDGIFGIVAAARSTQAHGPWRALLAEGVLNLIMGGIAFFLPAAAVLAFVLIVGVWAVVTGGLILAAAVRLHLSNGRGWLVFGGILSVAWGILLFAAPLAGAVVLTSWLGAYALVFGITLLILAFRLRSRRSGSNRWSQAPGRQTA